MISTKLLKREEVNTSRLYELDLLKALATVAMIICHAVIRLGSHHPGYELDVSYLIGDIFFGDYLAVAHAFMFAMGVGITFTKKNTPADLIRRGVYIYLLGFILNFFRYGIYALADGLIEGEFAADTVYALVVQDIFHFAGLALITVGILKRLRLNEVHILCVGVLLSLAGGLLAFRFQGSYLANYLLGHFVVTTEECSCFVFCNWFVFVGAGLLFGALLRRTEDMDRFWRRLLWGALPVMLVYVVLTLIFGPLFMTKDRWYYGVTLPEVTGLLSIDLVLLYVFRLLLKRIDPARFDVFLTMGRNVTEIYCIHWYILGFVDSIFCYLLGVVFPYPVIYLIGIALIFASYLLAKWRTERRRPAGTA